MELFEKRGYLETTVEDIATRAGLTERTFFRYFADKREVLFSGSAELEKIITEGIAHAPADVSPLEVVTRTLVMAGAALQALRELRYVRARHSLVVQHAEIQERELIKLAALARAITEALHARGVAEPAASLAAEAGIAVFKIGFERWLSEGKPSDFAAHIRAAMEGLKALAAQANAEVTREVGR